MTKREANQQRSLEAFLAKKAEFDALLAELQQASDDHFGAHPEAVLWGETAWLTNLAWEAAQLPLYTLWWDGSPSEIAWAVLHCTLGDGIIGAVTLGGAWLLTGAWGWPEVGFSRVAIAATIFGVGATVLLEWLNVELWRNWSYGAAMPRLPPLGTGLTPVLQWLLLPTLCLLAARRLALAR